MYGGLAERGTFGQAREGNGSREFPPGNAFPCCRGNSGCKGPEAEAVWAGTESSRESKVAQHCEQRRPEEGRSREVMGRWWEGGSCRVLEPRERTLPF